MILNKNEIPHNAMEMHRVQLVKLIIYGLRHAGRWQSSSLLFIAA